MARTKGISGVAIGMIATGILLVRAAIKGTSPLDEIRSILGGATPEPLSTQTKAAPMDFGGGEFGGTGARGSGAKLTGTAGVKPHVLAEMEYVAQTWGISVGGFATSGHITNSDHYVGLAFDAMLPSGPNRNVIGQAIADYYVQNAAAKHVKYVIWNHEIWTPGQGWHPYHGVNPHTNHDHVSFFPVIQGRIGR